MGFFVKLEFDVSLNKPYTRANPPASLRPIALFALKIARFVCDRTTTIRNEKLRSKGVAMHALAFPYTTRVPKSIKSTWAEPSKMSAKFEFVSYSDVDNECRFFFNG